MTIPKTTGYTELVKITEAALKGDKNKVIKYIKKFIIKHPESDLIHPFSHLLKEEINPSNLGFGETLWSEDKEEVSLKGKTKEDVKHLFFEEHTELQGNGLRKVITMPHDLFEWFWANQQPQEEWVSVEVKECKLYKIIVDKKEHRVNTQFINGKQIKILAGITEEMERLANHTYRRNKEEMGWFVFRLVKGFRSDEKIKDSDEVDLVEEEGNQFFTACTGTIIG